MSEQQYYESLSTDEKKCVEIAKKTLKTSFDITKSIGYLKWKNNK